MSRSVASSPSPPTPAWLAVSLGLADRVRRSVYQLLVPRFAFLIVDRDRRVLAVAVVMLVLAFLACVVSPLTLLAWGPIFLGVPHVLADVRYLFVEPGFHREWRLWAFVAPFVVWAGTGGGLVAGFSGTAVAFLVTPGRAGTRATGFLLCAALALLARHVGRDADVLFAHLHNVVSLVWLVLFTRSRSSFWIVGSFVVGCALLSQITPSWLASLPGPGSQSIAMHAAVLAPGAPAGIATTLVVLFAFAQATHYSVWLRLVPELRRERPAPRSYRASYRALVRDLGRVGVLLFVLAALAVVVYSAIDLIAARDRYLRVALFHGHFELALLAVWLVRGEFRRRDLNAPR